MLPALRRIKRFRRKYVTEALVKRAKKLLPVMYPHLRIDLINWDYLEYLLFPIYDELGIPTELQPFYTAWAKRKGELGLKFDDLTQSVEFILLINEFIARGLDYDTLMALEPYVDEWIKLMKGELGLLNFLTFTEVDELGHILVESSTKAWFDHLTDETSYLYKAYDVSGDFEFWLDLQLTEISGETSGQQVQPFLLSKEIGRGSGSMGDFVGLYVAHYSLWCFAKHGSNWFYSAGHYNLTLGTTYYLVLTRVGLVFTCKVYSDEARTSLLATLTLNLDSSETYTYIYAIQSWDTNSSTWVSGFVENLSQI